MDHSTFLKTKRFSGVDGIRALSALLVVGAHTALVIPGPRLFQLTYLGVDMFFAISGFLIVTLLLRERDRTGAISLKRFYIRRSLRIFPIYYLLTGGLFLAYFVASPWWPNGWAYYSPGVLVVLLYLQDVLAAPLGVLFHTWSLAMEEQFYLVWPWLEKLRSKWIKRVLFLAAVAVCQAFNFGLLNGWIDQLYGDPQAHLRPLFLCTFTPILFGVAVAHALNNPRYFAWAQRLCGQVWSLPVLLLLLIAIPQLGGEDPQGWPRFALHITMALILTSVVLRPGSRPVRVLDWKPLAKTGQVSYGLYLYHTVILGLLVFASEKVGVTIPGGPLLWLVVTSITLAVAFASYRWIEAPLLALRQRWETPKPTIP